MTGAQLIGWGASAVLVATIVRQIVKQWRAPSTEGVSPWLFVGQLIASIGFLVYSWLGGDPVFILTNGVLGTAAVVGLVLLLIRRRQERGQGTGGTASR